MVRKRIGTLSPRYSFILNPYVNERLSNCPKCRRLTHYRKFALFIHIYDWGPMVLGKSCRYCTPCELIIAHKDELEGELAHTFSSMAPDVVGNAYLALGTVDKKMWKRSLEGNDLELQEILGHMADFKRVLKLEVESGGWYPAGAGGKQRTRSRNQ